MARCLSEMRLVQNDLLEIIGMWGEGDTAVKHKHRIVLACSMFYPPPLCPSVPPTHMRLHIPLHPPAQTVADEGDS